MKTYHLVGNGGAEILEGRQAQDMEAGVKTEIYTCHKGRKQIERSIPM